MRQSSAIVCSLFIALLAASVGGCASSDRVDRKPPTYPLFNGTNLLGWWGEGTTDPRTYIDLPADELEARMAASYADIQDHWEVEVHEGVPELVNDGDGLYLTTEAFYSDFELSLEYKTVAGADSGVYLRGVPQVQIWDTTEAGGKWNIGADKGSGGLWNNSAGAPGKDPLAHADKPFGKWNKLLVRMVGENVTIWLNGKLVVDEARLENYYDRSISVPARGPIQLQTHGGEIRWRKVLITDLSK